MRVVQPPTWLRLVCVVPMLATAVVFAIGAAGDDELPLLFRVLIAVAAAAAVVVGLRTWFLRIVIDQDEIRVVNWVRTHRVTWAEVHRFEYDGGVSLWLRDMRVIVISAYAWVPGRLPSASRRTEDAARTLESIRRDRQSSVRRQGRRRKR